METLKIAETKSIIWAEAQVLHTQREAQQVEVMNLPLILGRWCFTNGSCKINEFFFWTRLV